MTIRKALLLLITITLVLTMSILYYVYFRSNSDSGNPYSGYMSLAIIIAIILHASSRAKHFKAQYPRLLVTVRISAYTTLASVLFVYFNQLDAFTGQSIFETWKATPFVPAIVLYAVLPASIVIAAFALLKLSFATPDIHMTPKN